MQDSRFFLFNWVLSSLVFYFAPFVFPEQIVTGNARLTPFLASIISGCVLAVFRNAATPLVNAIGLKLREEWHWVGVFLVSNVLGLWLIARYADLTGVGIANIWVAVILGVAVTLMELAVWKYTKIKK